jgi:hypothetical protein
VSLAFRAKHDLCGPFGVVHAKRRSVRVAERELVAVAVQMGLGDVVERSDDAALEQAEDPSTVFVWTLPLARCLPSA